MSEKEMSWADAAAHLRNASTLFRTVQHLGEAATMASKAEDAANKLRMETETLKRDIAGLEASKDEAAAECDRVVAGAQQRVNEARRKAEAAVEKHDAVKAGIEADTAARIDAAEERVKQAEMEAAGMIEELEASTSEYRERLVKAKEEYKEFLNNLKGQ